MALLAGARLGSYEIQAALGVGGMGEVYRARDPKLGRDVAIKVLPDEFLRDLERRARFEREARILAALNHPHIGGIYGFEEAGGSQFLVLELVEGDTLAERLARTTSRQGSARSSAPRIAIEEALIIARQIANALEAAHEKGIVHRDLKPANIILQGPWGPTPTRGKTATSGLDAPPRVAGDICVKVIDFGLATDLARTPTVTLSRTREGIVLGTAACMSPEQARGHPVDKRTDIWAFGCVLYEMLTGRRAFPGDTTSDTIAAILEREPLWTALPAATPPSVTRLLERCLQKDARKRLRDIGDACIEIEEALIRPEAPGTTRRIDTAAHGRTRFARTVGLLAIGGIVGALIAGTMKTEPRAPMSPATHFVISLAPNEQLAGLDFPAAAIAPDGSLLAYIATRGGRTQLFLRPMNSLEATAIPGTSNAIDPFFSLDSRWVAFFADGQLKKVPISGGAPITLCDAPGGFGGAWGNGDTIVFAAATGSGLSQVSASGGKPQRLTSLDVQKGEFSHRWPELLPDGNTVIYTVGTVGNWDDAQVVAQSLASGQRSLLIQGGTNPHYLPSGHLIYAHGGAIMAVPFDATRLTVTGTPVRVLDHVLESSDGAAQLFVSQSGSVLYIAGELASEQRRLVVVDRAGTATPLAAPRRAYVTPRLSPDGRKLLVTIEGTIADVWVYEITSGTLNQITFDANATSPVWTTDGQRATFSSNKGGAPNLFWTDISQPGAPERLAASENLQLPGSWSPDGRMLAFVQHQPSTGRDIWLLPSNGDRAARPFLASPFDEASPRFSPDGRWIAYVSNESGQSEVYLGPVTDAARKQRVSIGGGTEPVWARDGRELFYRTGDKMVAVSIAAGGRDVRAAKQETRFEGNFERGTIDAPNYDVTADQRFVMVQPGEGASTQAGLHVLLNWFGTLVSALPTPSR